MLLQYLADMRVNTGEVFFELGYQEVELAHVDGGTLSDDSHEDVFTDLDFLDEVLVIHDCYLEVVAGAQLGELVFEVGVQNVDAAAQPRQKVIVNLCFELQVGAEPPVDFLVILQLGEHDGFKVGHPAHKLHCLRLEVC